MDPDYWNPDFAVEPLYRSDHEDYEDVFGPRYAETPSPVVEVPEPMVRNDEAEPLYDWDREFENIYGVDELDPFNPLCKEPSEPSPDDDDPSEPTLLEEFDLDPGIYPRLKGSQEDVHEPGYRSGYVEDSSRCMVTAHDASSKPDTGREFFSSGGNSEMTTMPIDSKPKEGDLNGSSELQPAFYEPVPTKQKYNPFLFQPPGHTFDPTAFFKWLEHGPWPMIKNYLFPEGHGCPIYNSRRSVLEVLNYIMDASYRDKHKRARKKTMIEDEFIVAAKDIKTFIGNLKNRLYGKTISTDVPKSYIRQDLQNFLPPGVSDYLVPIEVRDGGMDFYYSTSIAMFADPFCSHALKMSVLYTARKDRTLLPKYASLLAEDVEKVWENMWSAQPPTKTEILILSNILKRRINVYTMEDGGRMDSGVFYDASPIESRERYHLSFVRFKNTYYPLLPKDLSSNSVAAVTPAVLADPEDCDLDNMLGMDPRFNTDDVDRSPQPNAPTLAFIHNKDNLDVDRSMISIVPFNSQVNPVVVMNAFSETGAQKIECAISGPTDSVVPDSDDPGEKEISNANLSLYDREGTKHSDFHAPLEKSTCNKALDCSKQTPRTTINRRVTCEQNGDINEEEALREVPNVDEQSDHLTLQPTETNARKLFKALRHIHSSHLKYFYASDRYRDLDGFPLVQHILQIHQLCTTCTTVKASVCGHNISGKQISRLALKNELSRTIYGSFVASDYAANQREQYLTMSIQSKLPGWTVIRSNPDGNCWYNAVSAALVGDQYLGKTLRRCAYLGYLARLDANDETMANFSKKIVTQNLLTDGAWATPAEMYLTSDVVGRKIIVYRTDRQWWTGTYYDADETQNMSQPPIYLLLQGNHFSALAKNSPTMTPQIAPYTPLYFRKQELKKQDLLDIIKGNNRDDEKIPIVVDLDSDDGKSNAVLDKTSDSQHILPPKLESEKESIESLNLSDEIDQNADYASKQAHIDSSCEEKNIQAHSWLENEKIGVKSISGRFPTKDFETLTVVLALLKTELLQLSKSGTETDLRKYVQELVSSSKTWSKNVLVAFKNTRKRSKRENKNTCWRIMKLQRHPTVQQKINALFTELSLQPLKEVYAKAFHEHFGTEFMPNTTEEELALNKDSDTLGNPLKEMNNSNRENHSETSTQFVNSHLSSEEGHPIKIKVEENSDNTDLDEDPNDDACLVSRDVLCAVLKCTTKDLKYQPPIEFSFVIPSDKMASCFDYNDQKGRFIPGSWVDTVSRCLTEKQQACSFSARSNPFYPKRIIAKGAPVDFCKFRGYCRCGMSFVGSIKAPPQPGNDCTVTIKSFGVFHLVQDKSTARQLRGKDRLEIAEKLRAVNAKTMYLNNLLHLPALRNLHNNHHQISDNVLRKIRSQDTSKLRHFRDPDKEVIHLKELFIKEDTAKGPVLGFIHQSNTSPNELAIWMHHANSLKLHKNQVSRGCLTTVHIDATGGVCSNRTSKQILLYVAHAVTDVNGTKISYPLAECLTECHSQLGLSRFLENTKLDMKKLGYRVTMPFANIVACDFSYAMLHGISKGVNDETLVAYINRAYRCLYEGEKWDTSKSTIFICSSHLVKAFQRNLYRKLNKTVANKKIVELGMYGIARLQESSSWNELSNTCTIVVKTFGSKQIPESELKRNVSCLKETKDNIQSSEDQTEKQTDESMPLIDVSTEEETKLLRDSSPFYKLFKKIRELPTIPETQDDSGVLIKNPYYCPTVIDTLQKDYMSLWPIWSNAVEQRKGYSDFLRTTNSAIEAEFNIRKQVYKTRRGRLYSDYVRESKAYNEAKLVQAVNSIIHSSKKKKARAKPKAKSDVNTELKDEKWRKRRKPKTTKYFTKKNKWESRSRSTIKSSDHTHSKLSRKRVKTTNCTTVVNSEDENSPKASNTSPGDETVTTEKAAQSPTDTNNACSMADIARGHQYGCVSDSKTVSSLPIDASGSEGLVPDKKSWDATTYTLGTSGSVAATNLFLDAAAAVKSKLAMGDLSKPVPKRSLKTQCTTQFKVTGSDRFGLVNVGNTCYLNSVLQMILSITEVRLEAITNPTTISKYCEAIYEAPTLRTREYMKSLKAELDLELPQFGGNEQQDAFEFLLAVMNSKSMTTSLPKSAAFTLSKTLSCPCGTQRVNEEHELCICIPPTTSVVEGVRLALMEETIDYKCNCGSNKVNCRREVNNTPKVLFVMAKIFDNNGQKVCNFQTVDNTITFGSNMAQYELKSIITHHGDRLNSGHYSAYVNENAQLYCINDEIVDSTNTIIGDPYLFLYCKK